MPDGIHAPVTGTASASGAADANAVAGGTGGASITAGACGTTDASGPHDERRVGPAAARLSGGRARGMVRAYGPAGADRAPRLQVVTCIGPGTRGGVARTLPLAEALSFDAIIASSLVATGLSGSSARDCQ